jgi:lysophospholipase L1-like esterase
MRRNKMVKTKKIKTCADLEKIKTALKAKTPLIWLFTGDSITHGAKHTYGMRSYPEHFTERIRFEIARVMDVVINTGISGNRIGDIIRDFQLRIAQFKPSVVSVMIGTNDCTAGKAGLKLFQANLTNLIESIRSLNSIPMINTPNPVLTAKSVKGGTRKWLSEYVNVARNVAELQNTVLVDHWAHWSELKENDDLLMFWLSDSVHPNAYGHIEIAKEIFKKLEIYDSISPTCSSFTP